MRNAPAQALVGGHRKSRPALRPVWLHSLAECGIRPRRPSERACGFMRTSEPGRRQEHIEHDPATTAETMTRQIRPDDAHSIAPDIVADAPAPPPSQDAAGRSAFASGLARGPQDPASLPPLDHAAIRTIIAGIMVAMLISALEQTLVAPALPAIG